MMAEKNGHLEEEPDNREDEDVGEDGEDGEGARKKDKDGKKRTLIILAPAFLLVTGGVATAYFTGMIDSQVVVVSSSPQTLQKGGANRDARSQVVFYNHPEFLVNLNTSSGQRSTYMKFRVGLELALAADVPKFEVAMPRIIDNFHVYLRKLRI